MRPFLPSKTSARKRDKRERKRLDTNNKVEGLYLKNKKIKKINLNLKIRNLWL